MANFSLLEIYTGILQLLLLGSLGFFLYRRKILSEESTKFLTDLLIKICVPSLIFTNLVENFECGAEPSVTTFLLLSGGIFLAGLILGLIFVFLRKKKIPSRETISLIAFQNSGYLPMTLVYFIIPSPEKETLLEYIFLYLLGFNILMWSVGSFFIYRRKNEKFKISSLLSPPVVAVLIALIFKKVLPQVSIPKVIFSPLKMLGEMSFVLSMLVLGSGLAKAGFKEIKPARTFNIVSISVIKLVVIPFLCIILLAKFKIFGIFGLFILLESCMPSAASLPIVARWKNANYKFVSQAVFFTHIFSLITIPFWINFFLKIPLFK